MQANNVTFPAKYTV